MMYEPCASRLAEYMKPGEILEQKQRRAAFAIELRRNKRVVGFSKHRRMKQLELFGSDTASAVSLQVTSKELVEREPRLAIALDTASQARLFRALLEGEEDARIKEAVIREMHKSLIETCYSLAEAYVAENIPAIIAEYCGPNCALAFQALSILCNISADSKEGEQSIANSGVIPKLIPFFNPPLTSAIQPAAFLLGNLVLSSTSLKTSPDVRDIRDIVLACIHRNEVRDLEQALGLAYFLGSYLGTNPSSDLIRTISEALAMLLSTPDSSHQLLNMVLSLLESMEEEAIYRYLDQSLVAEVVRALGYNWPMELQLALSILRKILMGEEFIQEIVINCGILDKIPKLLAFPQTEVRISAYNLLEAIVLGTKSTVTQLLIHPALKEALAGISDLDEAINKCVLNLVFLLTEQRQLYICERLLELDLLTEFSRLELVDSPTLSQVTVTQLFLEIIANLVVTTAHAGLPDTNLKESLCKSGCYDLITMCTSSANSSVSLLATSLLAQYFSEDEGSDSEDLPSVANFQFS